ncbi:heavy-metal-associated domain-containing protein [Micromonospora sp. LOL_023]|uniref:heavy-metal-associated domain-containing protein n=1 Tax=Micromonospora sp. LOL_023 TaxID=3345418 RepID=UPI003A8963FC
MSVSSYAVEGMTCAHCVASVTAEVGKIAGVTGVSVDLAGGQLTVRSEPAVSDEAVAEAVEEAGYQVVAG